MEGQERAFRGMSFYTEGASRSMQGEIAAANHVCRRKWLDIKYAKTGEYSASARAHACSINKWAGLRQDFLPP